MSCIRTREIESLFETIISSRSSCYGWTGWFLILFIFLGIWHWQVKCWWRNLYSRASTLAFSVKDYFVWYCKSKPDTFDSHHFHQPFSVKFCSIFFFNFAFIIGQIHQWPISLPFAYLCDDVLIFLYFMLAIYGFWVLFQLILSSALIFEMWQCGVVIAFTFDCLFVWWSNLLFWYALFEWFDSFLFILFGF